MKRIFATTALATLVTTAAFAGAHGGMFMNKADNVQILGSELVGSYVYASETEMDENFVYEDGMETEWDNVGDINEIVISRDGKIEAVVIGVGGFLGMGEKDVAVKMDSLRFVSDGEDADEYFVVVNSSQAALEGAPEWEDADRSDMAMYNRMERRASMYDADEGLLDGIAPEGYEYVQANVVTRANLIGTSVYGTKNEDIGEVEDLFERNGKKIAVLEVGGFLDMGDKHVAVPVDKLRVAREPGTDELRVYVSATEEQLEELPGIDDRY